MSPSARQLYSGSTKRVKLYVKSLHAKMSSHNIFKRVESLYGVDTASNETIAIAEAIDKDMTQLMLHCEKKLHKPSPSPFSSKLAQACLDVSISKLISRF